MLMRGCLAGVSYTKNHHMTDQTKPNTPVYNNITSPLTASAFYRVITEHLKQKFNDFTMILKDLNLWSPYVIGQIIYIFILSFVLLSFFPRIISAVGDWMSAILPHMV